MVAVAVQDHMFSGGRRNRCNRLLVDQMDRDALGGILDACDVIHPGEQTEVPFDPFWLKLHDWKNFRFLRMLPNLSQEGLGAAAKPGGRLVLEADIEEPDLILGC